MDRRASEGFGERLAYYRRLNSLSAESLSKRIPGVSRSVIANIESGRKADVTVDELLMLAWALCIPPVALALSIETPNAFVVTGRSDDGVVDTARTSDLVEWFQGGSIPDLTTTPATVIANLRLSVLREHAALRKDLHRARAEADAEFNSGGTDPTRRDEVDVLQARLIELEHRLRELQDGLSGLGVEFA